MKQFNLLSLSAILPALALAAALTLNGCGGDKNEVKLTAEQEKETVARIEPVGTVALASEVSKAPAGAASGTARSGEDVYNTKCMTCHATGAAGAPKMGAAADWAPRISKGMDALYKSALEGLKGMPPKGLCMDCSDSEINAAVDYMVKKSK